MRQKTLIGLTILATLSLFWSGCSSSSDAESHLAKAKEYIAQENFASAEIELKNALRIDPRNPDVVASLGDIYFQQGRFRDAFPYLNAAREIAPNNVNARRQFASILIIAGRPEQAREEAVKVLAADPTNDQAPLVIADSIQRTEDIPLGISILSNAPITPATLTANAFLDLKRQAVFPAYAKIEQAIKQDPTFGPAYTGRFAIAMTQGKQEEATEALRIAAENSKPRTGIQTAYADHLANRVGDIEGAKAFLWTVEEKAPDYLPALSRLAELCAQTNDMEKAKVLTSRALKLDPLDPTSMRLKAVISAAEEDYPAAIKSLEATLELYPQDIKANYQIALAYIASEDSQKAKQPLEFVSLRTPGNVEAAVLLATIQTEQSDFSGAVITLKRLVASRPDSPEAKLLLAEAYNRQGNYDAALALYDQVDASMGSDPELDYLSGLTQLRQENRNAARKSFEEALKTNPMHLQSVEQLTALDLSERSYDSALRRINESIDMAPDTAVLYVIKAQIQNAMGKVEDAHASFAKAFELDPKNRTAHVLVSRLYLAQGDTEKALEHLNIVLAENPEDIAILTTLAGIYEREKDYPNAKSTYDKILQIAPKNLSALNNLAYLISIEDGPTDRAVELAETARQVAPTNPYTADTLGWILYQRKEYARARALLKDSYTQLQSNAEVNYHVGAANYFLGYLEESETHLVRATSGDSEYNGSDIAKQMLQIIQTDPAKVSADETSTIELRAEKGDPVAIVRQGQIVAESGNSDNAVASYRKALSQVPNNLFAQLQLAMELSKGKNKEEAVSLAKAANKQEPNNASVALNTGIVAYRTGDYTWATSLLSQAVRQLPTNPMARLYFAKSLFALGKLDDAIAAAKDAKTRAAGLPLETAASQYVSHLSLIKENKPFDSADTAYEDPLVKSISDLLALVSDGNESAAKEKIEALLRTFPDNAIAKRELAKILVAKAETPERAYQLASDVRRITGQPTTEITAIQAIALAQQNQFRQSAPLFAQVPTDSSSPALWNYYKGLALYETGKREEAKPLLTFALESGLSDPFANRARAILESNE